MYLYYIIIIISYAISYVLEIKNTMSELIGSLSCVNLSQVNKPMAFRIKVQQAMNLPERIVQVSTLLVSFSLILSEVFCHRNIVYVPGSLCCSHYVII